MKYKMVMYSNLNTKKSIQIVNSRMSRWNQNYPFLQSQPNMHSDVHIVRIYHSSKLSQTFIMLLVHMSLFKLKSIPFYIQIYPFGWTKLNGDIGA